MYQYQLGCDYNNYNNLQTKPVTKEEFRELTPQQQTPPACKVPRARLVPVLPPLNIILPQPPQQVAVPTPGPSQPPTGQVASPVTGIPANRYDPPDLRQNIPSRAQGHNYMDDPIWLPGNHTCEEGTMCTICETREMLRSLLPSHRRF